MGQDYSLFDRVPVGVVVVDAAWRVRAWNACMATWTGIPPQEIRDHDLAFFFPRLGEARYRRRIEPLFEGGPPVILSYQLHGDLFPSRSPSPFGKVRHTTITSIRDGSKALLLFAVEDRTDAATRLREARVEIERRHRIEEELRKMVAYKEMLVREINHRVKNNLFLIQGLIELELDEVRDPAVRGTLKDLQGRIGSIATLHDRLYRTNDAEGVGLGEYFDSLASTIFNTFLPEGSLASIDLSVEPRHLNVDATLKLGLIATELLTNSLKHALRGRKDGRISLSISHPGGGLRLEVSDDGPGFPESRPGESGGLGMKVVSILAVELGGEFLLKPGKGGHAAVVLPPDAVGLESGKWSGKPE